MSHSNQNQPRHRGHRRWYVLLVTSLATMLLCLMFAYETVTVYSVESVIVQEISPA